MDKPTCSIEGCEKQAHCRTWCPMHYQRWRQNGDPLLRYQAAPRKKRPKRIGVEKCSIEDCEKLVKARGWCSHHWEWWMKYGDPLARKRGEVVDEKRICPACGIDRPLSEYRPGDNNRGRCKPCSSARDAEYRAANPFRHRLYLNPETSRVKSAAWRAKNPDKVRDQTARRRARKAGATIEHFSHWEVFERDNWICRLCGSPIDAAIKYPDAMSSSLDHIIPLSRGGAHSRANTQASHLVCNMRKHNSVA